MPPGAQESQKSELRRMLDDCETLQTGFKVGIEVREAQFGRGIFLSEDVEEGTELWSNEGVRMFRSRDELLAVLEGAAPEDVATLFDHLYIHVWLPSVGCHTVPHCCRRQCHCCRARAQAPARGLLTALPVPSAGTARRKVWRCAWTR
jgi:hypothetical protein